LTFKVNSKGSRSTVNVKINVADSKGSQSISDEVKLWFTLSEGRSIYAKVKSSNYCKLQYDHGIIEKWNKKWNLYGGVTSNKVLQNLTLRLGAAHQSKNCNSDNRIRVDFNPDNQKSLTWYNRTVIKHDKFTFGAVTAYGITSNVLVKNNLLFGYKINE
jgi:hypothetical protein